MNNLLIGAAYVRCLADDIRDGKVLHGTTAAGTAVTVGHYYRAVGRPLYAMFVGNTPLTFITALEAASVFRATTDIRSAS